LNANGLEIKQRVQQGKAFIDLTNIFVTAAKKLNFYGEKMGFRFWSKIRDSHFNQKYDFSVQFFDLYINI